MSRKTNRKKRLHYKRFAVDAGKRLLCGVLCVAMAAQPEAGYVMAKAEEPPVYLDSSRIEPDKLPEGDLLYFGTASANVEETGEYAVKIYREGNLDKKVSVDIHTVDMSATYGEDYELNKKDVENLETTGEEKTILEKYVKGQEITAISEEETGTLSLEQKSDAEETETEAEVALFDGKKKETAASTSSLAAKKEEQTGEETRAVSETETQSDNEQGFMDAIMDSLVTDSMENLLPSSISTVTFEKGQSEKTIRFSILEDDKSEGTEGFTLVLANPKEAEVYEVGSLGVSIQDDDKRVKSEVSFTKSEYNSKDGKVTLTVERTGAEYSVCDMKLMTSQDTAVAGTNYEEKNETLSFAPYEMEKSVEMEVSGEGKFTVLLSEFKACTEGKYTKAVVNIQGENAYGAVKKGASSKESVSSKEGASSNKIVRKKADDNKQSFNISIGGKSYRVEYTMGENTGKILDESYNPAVEAGVYYFSLDPSHYNGNFNYGYYGGDKPNGLGNRKSEYIYDKKKTDTMDNNFGKVEYYHTTTWKNGWAAAKSGNFIPGLYYQYLTADWKSKSDFGGGQLAKFVTDGTTEVKGKFNRQQDNAVRKNTSDQNLKVEIYACDENSNKTPKSYLEFYGVCAMYRKLNIKVENPSAKTYLNGSGSTVSMVPASMSVKCGAQPDPLKSGSSTRDVYANLSPDDTNFVFSVGDMKLNNESGIYAYINGYDITLEPGRAEDRVQVSYPKDFKNYLNNEVKKSSHKANLDFSKSAVDKEIKKIEKNLGTVPYDAYFFAWINSIQKATKDDGKGYRQNLTFKPIMEYYNVEVEVLSATTAKKTVAGAAHFTNSDLKNNGKKTYHAGDTLDLSVTCDDTDKYRVVGYQVSDDGGVNYNTITDTTKLSLRYDKKYKIRPIVSENSNAVEVRLSKDAESKFEVEGLIPQEQLKGTEFEGKNILNLDPDASTVKKMAEPQVGKEYTVRVVVKSEDKTYAYRPVIKHTAGNTSYTTQYYSFVAGGQPSDNIIEVGVSSVKRSDLKTYTVKGTLVSNISPIRQNGLAVKKLPVTGYTLSVGTGTQSKSTGTDKITGEVIMQPDSTISTTNMDGEYTLSGITGVPGDIIPVCISNGIVNGQVVNVKLANGPKEPDGSYLVNRQNTEISYPYGAPVVTSIDYTYDKKENLQKQGGNTASTVHIYDDTFVITAVVDNAGRSLKEAVFTVYHYGQDNSYDEYRIKTDPSNKNVYECRIPKMPETFHNGDGIKIRLVDSDNQYLDVGQYDENGNPITDDDGNFVKGQQVAIEYPDRDTGLTFYTENELLSPQTYDLENSPAVDVPLIGTTTGNTTSGLLTFGKTKWPDGTGYTLQIGADALFNMTGTPSLVDKTNGYQNMHKAAKQIASNKNEAAAADKELANLNAEDFIFKMSDGSLLGSTGMEEENEQGDTLRAFNNLLDEKEKMQDSLTAIRNDASSKAKKATAGLNKDGAWSVELALVLAFDFVYNPTLDDYVFSCGTVTAGGTFNFNKTKYTIISSVPAFINFSATLQSNVTLSYPTPKGKNALKAGDFDGYVGNLADMLSNPTMNSTLMVTGKVQVGVGMCGVLSARGYASIKLQFDIPLLNSSSDGGFLINATGGVGFDVLILSINFDIVNATWGFGTLENKTKFDFFGGLLSADTKGSAKKASAKSSTVAEGDTLLKTIGDSERVVMHPYSGGTSDMSSFGKNSTDGRKKATLTAVSVDTLLENAAERTRPQIIPLDGNKKMVVFLANRAGDKEHDTVLNYSVYDGRNWSVPKAVAEDSTTDSTPDILKVGNKVIIAWADANREFANGESTFDMLNAMGISVAIYDIASGEMGEEVSLVDDKYFNLSPKLNIDGTKIYCSYMKRDLSEMKTEDDLTNFKDYYSTMAYVAYDYNTAKREEEELISIKHDTIKDPLVLDYTSCTTVMNDKTYMLATYTVDEDENFDTNEDRELFLAITNLTDDRSYYPIQISNDKVAQASPQLTDINGVVYLTWLEDGYIFHILDASDLLEALFDESKAEIEVSGDGESTGLKKAVVDKLKYISKYMTEKSDNKDWYKKTAAELGIGGEYYEDSLYEELSEGDIHSESANFSQNEELQTSIGNYKLVTNGDDIFIFYTDGAADENTADSPASVEIYGVRYQRMMKEDDDSTENGASFEGLGNDEEVWGFGKAVQITHFGKVIDELDLYMTEDSRVHTVSNYFEQWIDKNGQIQYSENNLVQIEFETKNSMEVRGGLIGLPSQFVAGATENITFTVENAGLLSSKGFDYQVVQVTDGEETEIANEHVDAVLNAGEGVDITVPWTIPENISGTEIKVTVTETGVDQSTPYEMSRKVPYRSKLSFGETQVLWDEQEPYVSTVVKNIGNAASKAYTGALAAIDEDGNETTVYEDFELPALASGEEKELTLPFTPDLEDFNDLGIIKLLTKIKDGDNTLVEAVTQLASSKPVCARINDGKLLNLKVNGKTKLETLAAPWNSIAGDVKYASEDPDIATVGDDGEVIGNKAGETTVHAYYPTTGISASIPVKVSGTAAATGTSKIKASKSSIVVAAGKSKTVKFTATKDASASKAAAVKATVSDKKVISKATVSGSKVKITAAKNATKGASATVTLTSANAAGKTVKTKIKVTVQNKATKLTAKKTLTIKKGKKGNVSLNVTAQNNKKPATDTVSISSKKVSLVKYSVKKGKVTLTLKGEKKGTEKVTVKMGSKKVKLSVKVS